MKNIFFTVNRLNKAVVLPIVTLLFIGLFSLSASAQYTHLVVAKSEEGDPPPALVHICEYDSYNIEISNSSTTTISHITVGATLVAGPQSIQLNTNTLSNISSGDSGIATFSVVNIGTGSGHIKVYVSYVKNNVKTTEIYFIPCQQHMNCSSN